MSAEIIQFVPRPNPNREKEQEREQDRQPTPAPTSYGQGIDGMQFGDDKEPA